MWQYLSGDNLKFIDELAAYMKKAYVERPRIKLSPKFRHSIQRSSAYDSYSRLFQWVTQRGAPKAARMWSYSETVYSYPREINQNVSWHKH